MNLLQDITNWLRKILETDIGILLGSIFLLADIIGFLLLVGKKIRLHYNTILGLLLISVIMLLGLTIPILILVSSSWNGFGHIVLNLLAILAILSFLGLLYIIKEMNPFLKPTLKKEEATIHIRSTHSFFDGDINIYLVEENFGGRLIDSRIVARVWSPNYPVDIIKDKGVGHSIIYKGKSRYIVRIIKTATNEAAFEVLKTK